jgi:hypothetical protein
MYVNDRQHAAEFDHCDRPIVVERRGHVDGDRWPDAGAGAYGQHDLRVQSPHELCW